MQTINQGSGVSVGEGVPFAQRQAEARALLARIVREGKPQTKNGACVTRRGPVGADVMDAQVTVWGGIMAIRFWSATDWAAGGPGYGDKVRDLLILPDREGKGVECWLEADGKLFPHEGKYAVAARKIMACIFVGR